MHPFLSKHPTSTLIIITLASLVTLLSSDIYLPIMSMISSDFGTSNSLIKTSVTLFLLMQTISILLWGVLANVIGIKNSFIVGVFIFSLGSLLCSISSEITFFLIGRSIQGFGSSAVPVLGWAIIQEMYPKDKSAPIMSLMGSILSLSPVLSPFFGAQLGVLLGWKSIFFLTLLVCFIVLPWFIISYNNKPKVTSHNDNILPRNLVSSIIGDYMSIFSHLKFLGYASIFSLLGCAQWAFLTAVPMLYEKTYGLDFSHIGLMMSISSLFFIASAFIASRLMKIYRLEVLIIAGVLISLCSSICLLTTFLLIDIAMTMSLFFGGYLFGMALLWGATASRTLQCFPNQKAAASAARSLIMISFFTLGSFLGNLMQDYGFIYIVVFMVLLACIAFFISIATLVLPRKSKLTASASSTAPVHN